MLRFLNIIGASYLFVATTDPNRLAYALMQAGLPYRYGFMLITALRFIPLFQLELAQVRNHFVDSFEDIGEPDVVFYLERTDIPFQISGNQKCGAFIWMETIGAPIHRYQNWKISFTLRGENSAFPMLIGFTSFAA